jgi:1-deoxy-D-xylulose-5-phosphate reductoisomerase
VIHALVSYIDGSVLAQLGNPDMRTPIAYALAYPERIASGVSPLDLTVVGQLQFTRPDLQRFPCLKLAYDALLAGGSAAAILNAANEVAVQAFLDGKIGFRMIDQLIARTMDKLPLCAVSDIDLLLEQDLLARQTVHSFLNA